MIFSHYLLTTLNEALKVKYHLSLWLITAFIIGNPQTSHSALAFSDNAGLYTFGWGSSVNGATTPASTSGISSPGWTFGNSASGNGAENGTFLGGSQQLSQTLNINSSSGNAWGLYGNNGQLATATATLSSALTAGQVLTVSMQNNSVTTSGGTVGLNLKNSSGTTLFTFQFTGGATVYDYGNGGTHQNTSLGFYNNGLQIQATQGSANAVTILVTEQSSQGVFGGASWTETFTASAAIDQIQFFDDNAGSGGANNVYFNNLSVVPEPITLALPIFGGLVLTVGVARRFVSQRAKPVV